MYCDCGTKCRQWTGSVFMCPRCQVIYRLSEAGPKKIDKEQGPMLINMVEKFIDNLLSTVKKSGKSKSRPIQVKEIVTKETVVLPPNPLTHARASEPVSTLTSCERCGAQMDDKCGSICSNCKWMKPCSIE